MFVLVRSCVHLLIIIWLQVVTSECMQRNALILFYVIYVQ